MNALIIVDIQNDFLPGGALAVTNGDQTIAVANRLLGQFDLHVATQDWHPAGHLSFAESHPGKEPGDLIKLDGLDQVLWPVHCVQNTFGADFAEGLEVARLDRVFRKGTNPRLDSYSGFFDNGHKASTGLDRFLKDRFVDEVFVLGLATDYCVKFTVLDSLRCGFATHLVTDACRAVNLKPNDEQQAIKEMSDAGATCLTSDEIAA